MNKNLRHRIAMSCVAIAGVYFLSTGMIGSCKKMNPGPLPYHPRRLPNGMTPEEMHERAVYQQSNKRSLKP